MTQPEQKFSPGDYPLYPQPGRADCYHQMAPRPVPWLGQDDYLCTQCYLALHLRDVRLGDQIDQLFGWGPAVFTEAW